MASIGELTATVRADISGYTGPMQQVVATNQQVTKSVVGSRVALNRIGQTAILVANQTAGFGGQIGSLAARLSMLAGGGGIMFAVGAAIAGIGAAFKKATEETRAQEAAIDDLKTSYDEMYGAAIRLRLEQARDAVARLREGKVVTELRTTGRGQVSPETKRVIDTEALNVALQALNAAERAYADHLQNLLTPAQKAAAQAAREFADALKNASKIDTDANTNKKVSALTKEAQAWRQLKADIVAAQEAERERANELPEDLTKAKAGDVKQGLLSENTLQGARDAANGVAAAFTQAFTDNENTIMERVSGVLRRAMMEAVQRVLAQKIFEGILTGITGGKGGVVSDIVGGFLGAPPSMASAGGGIIVPLDNLPPPLSPVEYARDNLHMAVWVATERQARANGVSLRVRGR